MKPSSSMIGALECGLEGSRGAVLMSLDLGLVGEAAEGMMMMVMGVVC